MDTLLYWLEHADDKGVLSITALVLFGLLFAIWFIKYMSGVDE